MTLSDDGHLQCSYLGTDPSLFQAPKVEARELNYDDLDRELKELQTIIKDVNRSQGISLVTLYYLILICSVKFKFMNTIVYRLVNFLLQA